MKRPSFQFYPADWRSDAQLQTCSLSAKGLWVECLCIAHTCQPYGHLTVNGKPMTTAQLARLVGIGARECEKLVAELEVAGVASRSQDGALVSRRMVRDEQFRQVRAEGGKAGSVHGAKGGLHGVKGGRPRLDKGGSEHQERGVNNPPSGSGRGVLEPPSKPSPSSSSSASAFQNASHSGDGSADPPPLARKPTKEKPEEKPRKQADTPHQRAVAGFCRLWAERYGEKFSFGESEANGKVVKEMLAEVGQDDGKFLEIAARYLADDDPYYAQKRHPLPLFRSQFNKWKVAGPSPTADRPTVYATAETLGQFV